MSKQIHDESDRNKQVKFRCAEEIVDALDEVADERDTSRAHLLREAVDETLDDHGHATGQSTEYWPEREDLAALYQACLKHSNQNLVLNLRVKGSMVAQDTRYSQDDLVAALRPLEKADYVCIQTGGVFGKNLSSETSVRVKPTTADPKQWKYGANNAE